MRVCGFAFWGYYLIISASAKHTSLLQNQCIQKVGKHFNHYELKKSHMSHLQIFRDKRLQKLLACLLQSLEAVQGDKLCTIMALLDGVTLRRQKRWLKVLISLIPYVYNSGMCITRFEGGSLTRLHRFG